MFRKLSRNKAQTILEYAILIGVVVAGIMAMQVYLKRGLQGRIKSSADTMGEQFSPGHTQSTFTTHSNTASIENLNNEITTTNITHQESNRVGSQNVATFNQEQWW